jgi:type VI secretion system protein ImpH
LDEASEDRSVTREFLDIFSSPFYRLFFKGWSRSRWYVKITEEEAAEYLERLFCLVGLGSDEFRAAVPQARGFLRYIGLFTQFPRSALGLATLLTDALDVPHVEVVPHLKRLVRIPDDQRLLLGDQSVALGEETHLGEEIEDRMGKIGIRVHGLDAKKFHDVLPGRPLFDQIYSLTDTYLNQPLERELELVLDANEIETVVLGGEAWSHLGHDTWTFSTPHMEGEASVKFRLGPFC